jgi:probable addiction module antidote protein
MDKLTTAVWDAADHLKSDEDIRLYLEAAFEDGDPELIAAALSDVARAKGLTAPESENGAGRRDLNGALQVLRAAGLRLTVAANGKAA